MKNIKKPYFKKPIGSLYETMNDKGESVVRFRSNDNRERFIGTSLDPNKVHGGDTPSPSPMPSGGGMVEVKWQELKDKRDNGELNPGSLYRITDYNCTTTQENTQSAGHQFDIVLLALSENKLAEEGWAMMNESNIYDVTFLDGVTKKCYLYELNNGYSEYCIVDVQTLLGIEGAIKGSEFIINEESKTVSMTDDGYDSNALELENLPYNYFQNSNLSAWKVWYCLDNDTARFAWADDSVDEGSPASIIVDSERDAFYMRTFYRNSSEDNVGDGLYAWSSDEDIIFTNNSIPSVGDVIIYNSNEEGTIYSYTPAHEGLSHPEYIETVEEGETVRWIFYRISIFNGVQYKEWKSTNNEIILTIATSTKVGDGTFTFSGRPPRRFVLTRGIPISNYQPEHLVYNGRGVIYRLIDEFNNDVSYDFKNIQFIRPMTDGEYDPEGEDTWVYTFSDGFEDSSIPQPDGEGGFQTSSKRNYIGQNDDRTLNNIVAITCNNCNFKVCSSITLSYCYRLILSACGGNDSVFSFLSDAIYINNKKVLTEQ